MWLILAVSKLVAHLKIIMGGNQVGWTPLLFKKLNTIQLIYLFFFNYALPEFVIVTIKVDKSSLFKASDRLFSLTEHFVHECR